MLEYSVVIPTHNRKEVLAMVLKALEAQARAPSFETVVVDDGSRDGTFTWLEHYSSKVPLRVFKQMSSGPAAARNLGIREARGQHIAFLGDDTIPDQSWLFEHQEARRRKTEEVAVVGLTEWHPRISSSPFGDWLNNQGKQFGYALIDKPDEVPFNFFYTSNLSVPRSLLVEAPFREEFPHAAWEDIELGYRLIHKGGLRLVYNSKALTLHDHPTVLVQSMRRQQIVGASAVLFWRLHPELKDWLRISTARRGFWWRLGENLSLVLAKALSTSSLGNPWWWGRLLDFHYTLGLGRGLAEWRQT